MQKLQGVILDLDSMGPESLDLSCLLNIAEIDWQIFDATTAQQAALRVADADIVLTNKVALDREIIAYAKNLRYIGVLATGVNNIDMHACEQAGITVKNVSRYGTASVAQHTLMLMLMLATSVNHYNKAVKQGAWQQSEQFCLLDYPIMELAGKHLVIVGYGTLGKAVAKLAEAFDMRVTVALRPGDTRAGTQSRRPALEDVLPRADFVSLHCALSPDTAQMINAERLALMRSSAFLINTARGGLVDEDALLHALEHKQIAGAALDVVSTEPPPQSLAIVKAQLPNLLITPHVAWAATEARQRLLNIAASHLDAFIQQSKPQ
ncbi:D-2-hydroxyacid dehydrogenase [Alteromonas sp. ASW11-36]|uniref:D-2-hydroxyacid dehydrogenase n=1 Tax=Alteromonas arenosi TaxID=3055817 RepID=A0ABT7T0S3_9ALTE|nr:D-2-hydroxyacid dehydrogenase [Alteromonas sp. ASW11-36]MDM7862006.1 D-2-hydroxyacid dehydrogenase [Alteromonas sp. ASW11-36]